ncbi:MAG: hypothetical protein CVV64_05155 [Candidatus Wallbacteria bacterium HGW-Wallbacteria-1]|jgi:TldD protein|uniref:Metalloprotease TldD/E C-terminal domain-containing protein n=1 Tax=Candidatus Wallbacteria bacterium HGW-Wallbacteria-1 TaxID=2013854 RepID=A0A2N1PS31_9BACT|nr:MAG: hypothetical protein CVV64_05155 [Candidatus Wallbacteria bacterium HGW-Wallbacteria-1]
MGIVMESRFEKWNKIFSDTAMNLNVDHISLRMERMMSRVVELDSRGRMDVVNRELEGGIIESVGNAGIGRVVFTGEPDLAGAVVESARAATELKGPSIAMAGVDPVNVKAISSLGEDFSESAAVISLLKDYGSLLNGFSNGWKLIFREVSAWKGFANTEGSRGLRFERFSYVVPEISAGQGVLGHSREVLGGAGGLNAVENLHEALENLAGRARRQSAAVAVKPGIWPVVLDPKLSGLFFHEAVGHLLEADYSMNNPRIAEITSPGTRIAAAGFSAMDDPTITGGHGSYDFDDEGVAPEPLMLVEDGLVTSRLHSRLTAASLREKATGHARAINFMHPSQVRMSNTFVLPGKSEIGDLIGQIDEGYYLVGTGSGETGMENFSFSCAEAFAVRSGQICEPVRAPSMSGNIFQTLMDIRGMGNENGLFTGFCGKNGQIPLPVSFGGPSLLLGSLLLG